MDEKEKKEALQGLAKEVAPMVTEAITPEVVKLFEENKEKLIANMPRRKDIFDDSSSVERQAIAEQKQAAAEYLRKKVNRETTKSLSAGVSTLGAELVPTY